MKTICFYFQIHQPFRLKRYRFFDIGKDNYYYDDFNNESIATRLVHESYLPAIHTIKEMIENSNREFKVAFSISGTAIEQFEVNAPEVLENLQKLAATGCVEFLAETYAHSLSSLIDPIEFEQQVQKHSKKIEALFAQKPTIFRNTELIYSEEIGEMVANMGFKGML
ncbi:MAG: polysaccharide deacetylase family protein, partial [Bacteroidales bacterium]